MDPVFAGPVRAAKEISIGLNSMANDLAAAVLALWSQGMNRAFKGMNRAFKGVENMRLPCHDHFKTLVIIVAADLTLSHRSLPFEQSSNQILPKVRGWAVEASAGPP